MDKMETPSPELKPTASGPRSKKSDRTTISQRVEEILRLRLDGAQFHDIVQYASEKGWGVGERMIRKYIAKADALLVERMDKNSEPVIARHIAQRQTLYARAVNAADSRTALAIIDSEAKLRGLFPEKELKKTVPGATPDNEPSKTLSHEEAKLIALVAARKARREYTEPDFPLEPPTRKESVVASNESPRVREDDEDE